MTSLDITNGVRTALTHLREAWEWYDAIPPVRKIHSALGQVADGWRRISRWLNSVMPKGLYARALLIIIAPMVILQSVVAFVFMERHWNVVTQRLSASVVQDIAALIDIYRGYPQDADQALEKPGGQDDEEDEGERALDISARRHGGRSAGHAFDHHGGHDQRHHASRRVHEAGRAAKQDAGEEHDDGAQQTGEDAVGDEAVAERLEGEKPIADAQRNGQDSCADTPSQVARGTRSHEYDASPSLSRGFSAATLPPDRMLRPPPILTQKPGGTMGRSEGQSLPTRYMLPVGAGTPPAGSRVTANVSGGAPDRRGATRRLPTPLASTAKTPAGTGAPVPAMAQSS